MAPLGKCYSPPYDGDRRVNGDSLKDDDRLVLWSEPGNGLIMATMGYGAMVGMGW